MILKPKNPSQAKAHTSGIREQVTNCIVLIILALTTAITLISLLTHNRFDNSLCYTTTAPTPVTNWLGTLGAHWSALLLYFFGTAAYLLPLILFFVLKITLHKTIGPALKGTKESQTSSYAPYKHSLDRLLGLIFLVPLSCTIAHVYSFELYAGMYPGGLCGLACNNFLLTILAEPHVHLFLFMITWAVAVIIARFSFITYLYPLINLLRKIPLRAYSASALKGLSALIKKLIRQPALPDLTPADVPQTIFQEPTWQKSEKPPQQWTEQLTPAYPDQEPELDDHDEQPLEQLAIEPGTPFRLPTYALFPAQKEHQTDTITHHDGEQRAATLEHKLERFGIKGKVVSITQGPVVTLFEYQPSIDTKISTIVAREDDLALALQALSLRIIAPIPGRSVIGFEVAHAKRRAVLFCHLLKSSAFSSFSGLLPLILGKDTLGNDVVIDLATMPHLLVAGSTGSGKSVGLHAMIMSLLCSKTPDEIKFILIDPKRLEFAAYADIAHLLFPIVTDPARAVAVLKWAVATMEDRYATMAEAGVRNAAEYNSKLDPSNEAYLPSIVIIIDELADLMMTAGKDVENLIARLAQMARAAGIHLIVATQRPSVDVITGLIKVNFPSRVAYKVTSKVDSRTILDCMGAEKLLGKGDMLFLDTKGVITRVHGAYVTDTEISLAVNYIKAQRTAAYAELISLKNNEDPGEDSDELFQDVIEYLKSKDEISISLVQRVFRIGYNRSARIIDQLESSGYILPSDGAKMRKVNKEI